MSEFALDLRQGAAGHSQGLEMKQTVPWPRMDRGEYQIDPSAHECRSRIGGGLATLLPAVFLGGLDLRFRLGLQGGCIAHLPFSFGLHLSPGLLRVQMVSGDIEMGNAMSKTMLLTVAIVGTVLVGGGVAIASSGIVGFLGMAGMTAVHVVQDDVASRSMPIETFRIGAMLDRPSGSVHDTTLFSIATYQVRGLADLHPGLERRFRGRALTLPLEEGRHLVLLLFGHPTGDGRSSPLPWTSAGSDGVVPRDSWPRLGIWDGNILKEVDSAALPAELRGLQVTSRRSLATSTATGDGPLLLDGRNHLDLEGSDGEPLRFGISEDEYQRRDF